MRENPLGGEAGHAHPEVQTRADRDDAAADRSWHRERENHSTSLQRSRDYGTDEAKLTATPFGCLFTIAHSLVEGAWEGR
jgi:hypothetical protein